MYMYKSNLCWKYIVLFDFYRHTGIWFLLGYSMINFVNWKKINDILISFMETLFIKKLICLTLKVENNLELIFWKKKSYPSRISHIFKLKIKFFYINFHFIFLFKFNDQRSYKLCDLAVVLKIILDHIFKKNSIPCVVSV